MILLRLTQSGHHLLSRTRRLTHSSQTCLYPERWEICSLSRLSPRFRGTTGDLLFQIFMLRLRTANHSVSSSGLRRERPFGAEVDGKFERGAGICDLNDAYSVKQFMTLERMIEETECYYNKSNRGDREYHDQCNPSKSRDGLFHNLQRCNAEDNHSWHEFRAGTLSETILRPAVVGFYLTVSP